MKNYLVRRMVVILSCAALLAFPMGSSAAKNGVGDERRELKFTDAHAQAVEFIGYYHSIKLAPDEEKIKADALEAIPAPCCKEFSMATCCCPCNMAKSVWGLSHFLIRERHYDARRLKAAVEDWLRFSNKRGYSGNACDEGHCNLPFAKDGCGGMNEKRVL